ncbi:hypothetical protein BofuT4_P062160.1 [Botrytis cinerea T4]|uniref:Uncharacterized protein n=1 Tax=Botryotinia fuckeliana (strain T4) TaxID=999810 RepID=G2XU36_BOTF4|nr:hypothetical protein BofuT4_P062160.1 [Botrytis cinerea T4]
MDVSQMCFAQMVLGRGGGLRRNVARELRVFMWENNGKKEEGEKDVSVYSNGTDGSKEREVRFPIETSVYKKIRSKFLKQHSKKLEFLRDLESWKRCRKRKRGKIKKEFLTMMETTSSSLFERKRAKEVPCTTPTHLNTWNYRSPVVQQCSWRV